MNRAPENFRGIVCLLWLLVAAGCGTSAPPPTDSPDSPGPTSSAGAAPDRAAGGDEAQPVITVEQQELQVQPASDPGLEVVRRYTRMFYDGEMDELRARFSEEMKTEFPPGRLEVMRERVREGLGEETEILGERSQSRDEYRGFVRWARFSKHDGVVEIQWVLRQDDTVAGFIIREAQAGGEPRPESAE